MPDRAPPHFGLLGPMRVLDPSGAPVELGGPRQRALLAILLLDPGKVVPTERLVDLLWGDSPPSKPLASLQAYVSRLRRALDPAHAHGSAHSLLDYRGGGYVVDVDRSDVDVFRFEQAAAAGAAALAEGRWDDAVAHLDEGLALWRGPALADVADEIFAIGTTRRLDDLRVGALEDRLEADLHRGLAAAVAAGAEELLIEHPYRERLVRLQLLALYRAGRQAEALRAANRFRERLAGELGLDPSPTLQRLELDILQQAPDLDVEPARAAAAPPSGAAERLDGRRWGGVAAADLPADRSPVGGLAGRLAELEVVDSVVADALAGRGRVLVLSGEPGIGKTRLAQEAASRAVARGLAVHWARCTDGEATPSLWPWAQLVRSLARRGGADLAAAAAPHAARLAALVPELQVQPTAPLPSGDNLELSRLWLFDAALAYLRAAAALQPVVLVLDDAQWMDTLSLRLLHAAVIELTGEGSGPSAPIAIVATVRTDDPTANPAVPGVLADLDRLSAGRRLVLAGLPDDAVREVLAEVVGAEPDEKLVATVARRTAGNPFFVREIGGLVARDPGAADHVPSRVRELVVRRLRALPSGADRVVVAAAVLGRSVDLDVVDAMVDLGGDDVLDLIEAAVTAGMLREDETIVGRYHFTHDLVRDTVLAQLSGVRRARLHRRAFDVLASRPAQPDALVEVDRARHAIEAAPLIGVERAVDTIRAACDIGTDTGRWAHDDAAVLCRRALDALDHLLDDRSRGQLLYVLGDNLCRTTALAEGQQVLDQVLELAQRVGDDDLYARAALDYGGGALLSFWLDHRAYDPAIVERLERARQRQPTGTKLHVELTARLAVELYSQPDRDHRIALADAAVTDAGLLGDPVALTEALVCRLLAGWTSSDALDRRALAERIIEVADQTSLLMMGAIGRHYQLACLIELGDIEAAERLLPDYLARTEACPMRGVVASSMWLRATLHGLRGAYDEAAQLLEAARHVAARMRPGGSAALDAARALFRYERTGAFDEVQPGSHDALDIARRSALARMLARSGEVDRARQVAAGVAAAIAHAPDDFALTTSLSIASELALDLHDEVLAAACRARLAPLSGRFVVLGNALACRGAVDHYLGLDALVLGDDATAHTLLTRSHQRHEALGATRLLAGREAGQWHQGARPTRPRPASGSPTRG